MNVINKQKFLAELGKLLTFMYEEDRQLALAMYADMFEEAESENALLQALISPTKQAVLVARSYNAKSRNPKSNKKNGDGESTGNGETPEFVKLIESIRSDIFSYPAAETVPAHPEPKPAVDLEAQLEAENAALQQAEKAEEEHYFTHITELEEAPAEPEDSELSGLEAMTEDRSMSYNLGEDQESDEEAGVAEESGNPAESEEKLNNFMAEYASPVDHLDPPENEEGIEVEFEDLGDSGALSSTEPDNSSVIDILSGKSGKAAEKYERKPRVFLLILYILAAIPIGLIGTVILLIPTLLFLALAAATIMVGVALISAAFSNFAVVADFLVVVGASIVVMAIGILFLWTFLWFIIGAIAGLIRGLCTLGGKWCYKEVKVNG